MTLTHILETDHNVYSWDRINAIIKINVNVHCSCGNDYKIKDRFKQQIGSEENYIRPTRCSKCKELSYLEHTFGIYIDKTTHNVEIVTKKILENCDAS